MNANAWETAGAVVGAWTLVSVPVGVAIGRRLHRTGQRPTPQTPPPAADSSSDRFTVVIPLPFAH